MLYLYRLLTYLLVPVLLAHLYWRSFQNRGYRMRIAERFGRVPFRAAQPTIWIHAVSVGEVQAAAPLIRALQRKYPAKEFIVTTMTPTGSQRVTDLFGDSVLHSYIPYDLGGAVRGFFDAANPELAIIMETELWPNLYRECERRNVPLVLANARISQRSVRWYRRIGGLIRETLARIVIAAQSDSDAARFVQLGADPSRVHVTGNLKFDIAVAHDLPARGAAFRRTHAPARTVWVAASTHADEEEAIIAVHGAVMAKAPDALLLLVPRHPERFPAVKALLERSGLNYVTRSSGVECRADTAVFLGDSMGELTMLYAAADVAFVGGSLTPIGGHNLLEPAALGVPVLTGPHNFNAPDIARLLSEAAAARVVAGTDELARALIELLSDEPQRKKIGEAGRAAVARNRGALERVVDLIDPLLPA